jgi:hypothetical protein
MRTNLPLIILALATAGLLLAFGCGDDGDPVDAGNGDNGATYDSPDGQYNVTSSSVNATIVDSNLPSQLVPFVEQWIEDIIGGGGSSTCHVSQNLLILLKTESEACVDIPYVYDEDNRSCTQSIPVTVEDLDVSSLDLCETIPSVGEHCVQTVSIAATFEPNLVWPASFATFSGSEAIGSAQNPSEMDVVVSGTLGGTYWIDFYASRNLSGTRCSDCATCPTGPPAEPSPNGDWDVTSTNVSVTVTNSSLPSQLNPYIEQWIEDLISNGGTSEWNVAQTLVVLSRIETDTCTPMVYRYDPNSRRCTTTTPVDISDVDVSSLGLCEDIPPLGTHCLTEISLDANFTPNLQWTANFDSFSGSEMIGSAQDPASVTIVVTGTLGGEYDINFYSSRNVSGTPCSGCTPCR